MQVEAMQLMLRPRDAWEGSDIGVRLLQDRHRAVYTAYLVIAAPLFALCLTTLPVAPWLPALLIWWLKPWLDRTILFALSRTLFGMPTPLRALWAARREVWLGQLAESLTLRRLTASRAFTQPLAQLEGLRGAKRRARARVFTARHRGVARMVTQVFALCELALYAGLAALPALLQGPGINVGWFTEFGKHPLLLSICYALSVLFLEPFYVAAGFGMYLNRRVELEAWDIEQEFRIAFRV